MSGRVVRSVVMVYVATYALREKVLARLCWWASDPYAVELNFTVGKSRVRWLVARELLAAGRGRPAGLGDVRIAPAPAALARPGTAVVLTLDSPDGYAELVVPLAGLDTFLADTFRVVPAGHESAVALSELDACLAQWLSGGQVGS